MAQESFRAFLDWLEVLRPALTAPSFRNMLVVLVGWVLTSGPHAVTQALVATQVPGRRHHEAFHRFFSRGTWKPDELGRLLFERLLRLVPVDASLRIAIDDTHAEKKGPKIFGLGNHLDPVRSTRLHKVFCFGHCWVVLSLVVPVPFSHRTWSLPLLLRLYRTKKEAMASGHYRKKTELAREMLDVFVSWVDGRRPIEMVADCAYCNDTVFRDLLSKLVAFGSMRPDAVLTAPPAPPTGRKPGRRRIRGDVLPKPEQLARDGEHPWQTCEADLYGERKTVHYKTLCGQWYRACGTALLRIVVVRVDHGAVALRVFFATDPHLSVRQILEGYAQRWSIEVCFRELKQLLGFADSSARKKEAVERMAPFVAYIYTLIVLWAADGIHTLGIAAPPLRPWYRHKRGLCFADLLRAAQRTFVGVDVLDPLRSIEDLRQPTTPAADGADPQAGYPVAVRRRAA